MIERSRVRFPAVPPKRCNSGQVVHTHVPLFTMQYKLIPASAGGKVHHRSGVGYAGSHSADLAVGGQPAPLQYRSYLWLPLYSGLEVTCHLRRYINWHSFTFFYLLLLFHPLIKLGDLWSDDRPLGCPVHKTLELDFDLAPSSPKLAPKLFVFVYRCGNMTKMLLLFHSLIEFVILGVMINN